MARDQDETLEIGRQLLLYLVGVFYEDDVLLFYLGSLNILRVRWTPVTMRLLASI